MNNKNKISINKLTIMALCIALNIVGAFIALNLRLPIYLDSIGTIMAAVLLGPKYGVMTGLCGSIVSGITFDIYSLYFAPVQISTGLLSGIMSKKGFLKGIKMPLGVLIFSIPTSIISAIIAAFVFDGVTSSGSSYIVSVLSAIGVNKVISVFITQAITDYIDKFIAVVLVSSAVFAIPRQLKQKMTN